ncbi:hypothetical protein [Skermanella stibiiresistens]|uniref:hypothetical protein n=1 Tax=Skermanella stibiiresistens TaxID=913326 RepID=UPI0012FA34B1|nr:hypothetical protein [Skermanella stibiiresistens]
MLAIECALPRQAGAQQAASPGAGTVASGITPARYAMPTAGSGRLTASVPPLPPTAPPPLELSGEPPAPPASAARPVIAKITPYQLPVFWPPPPRRKPEWFKEPIAAPATMMAATAPVPAPIPVTPSPLPSPTGAEGYTAVVPITVFGAAENASPKSEPTLAELAGTVPIVFTVRLPTIVLPEPDS